MHTYTVTPYIHKHKLRGQYIPSWRHIHSHTMLGKRNAHALIGCMDITRFAKKRRWRLTSFAKKLNFELFITEVINLSFFENWFQIQMELSNSFCVVRVTQKFLIWRLLRFAMKLFIYRHMAQTHIHMTWFDCILIRFISLHYFPHYNASNEFWHLRLTRFDICSKNCNFDICGRHVMTFAVNQILTFAGIMTFAVDVLWHLRDYDICGWRVMTFEGIMTFAVDVLWHLREFWH